MAVDITERRTEVGKRPAGGGWNPRREHDLFGECLGRFELGCGSARTEHQPSLGTQAVGHAASQRCFGAYNT
jgi:hypothetical protein